MTGYGMKRGLDNRNSTRAIHCNTHMRRAFRRIEHKLARRENRREIERQMQEWLDGLWEDELLFCAE